MKVNADGGKNRGWLLPPANTTPQAMSGLSVLDGGKVEAEFKAAFAGTDDGAARLMHEA